MFNDSDARDAGIGSSQRLSLILIALVAPFLGAASSSMPCLPTSAAVAHKPSGRLS
jgi:hypothetical protein